MKDHLTAGVALVLVRGYSWSPVPPPNIMAATFFGSTASFLKNGAWKICSSQMHVSHNPIRNKKWKIKPNPLIYYEMSPWNESMEQLIDLLWICAEKRSKWCKECVFLTLVSEEMYTFKRAPQILWFCQMVFRISLSWS